MKKIFSLLAVIFSFVFAVPATAQEAHHDHDHVHSHDHGDGMLFFYPSTCGAMEIYDFNSAMCMPLPMADMPMSMLMIQGNAFLAGITESGPRGRSSLAFPDMVMVDAGKTIGDHNYLNLDFMGTVERWTLPDQGYPELLQIGEENNQGVPYVDAQHPHSSPIMGLTLSDTLAFGDKKDYLKIFAAPRGEATEGPMAFMHRPTGVVNPDAPLGHHLGQDVAHIVSTLAGTSVVYGSSHLEFSTYHGAEPQPQNVDLPLGNFDSYAARVIEEVSDNFTVMASYAYVSNPEPNSPDIKLENRYSVSLYDHLNLGDHWTFDNTLIFGSVSNYDHASSLTSYLDEFLFNAGERKFWGRIEYLQRTPSELAVSTSGDPNIGLWVGALTLGFTERIMNLGFGDWNAGISVTNDFLPPDYQGAYGGNPWSGKIFLQVQGMKMVEL